MNYGYKGSQVEEAEVLGFMHRPLEFLEAQDVREVQQGSCEGRDLYAVVDGDLIAAQPAGAVDAQALAAARPALDGTVTCTRVEALGRTRSSIPVSPTPAEAPGRA